MRYTPEIENIIRNRQNYRATYEYNGKTYSINTVIIDGYELTGCTSFTYLAEKSFVKSPDRSSNGSMGDLNNYATFLSAHLKMDFSLMPITVYRKIMDMIYTKNMFTVTCYDVVYNRAVTKKMYFATEEMPTLWTIVEEINNALISADGMVGNYNYALCGDYLDLCGVKDYTVEMIDTNNPLDKLSVVYHLNAPSTTSDVDIIGGASLEVAQGEDFMVGANTGINNYSFTGYKFSGLWNTSANGSGEEYRDGEIKNNLQFDLVLYAQWVSSDEYTLSYNYGLGEPKIDSLGMPIYSKRITKGQAIGELPNSGTIKVKYKDKWYDDVYQFKGWYTTPQIGVDENGNEQQPLKPIDTYNVNANITIYQIYLPIKHIVNYYSNYGTNALIASNSIEYGASVPLYTPPREGYAFEGWYLDSATTQKFSGSMPPYSINLYAKWKIVE